MQIIFVQSGASVSHKHNSILLHEILMHFLWLTLHIILVNKIDLILLVSWACDAFWACDAPHQGDRAGIGGTETGIQHYDPGTQQAGRQVPREHWGLGSRIHKRHKVLQVSWL